MAHSHAGGDEYLTEILAASRTECAGRRRRAVEAARERGLAGLLVWSRNATTVDWYGDVYYLTNHHTPFPQLPDNPPAWAARSHSVLVLPVDAEPVLVVDSAEYRADLVSVEAVRVGFNVPRLVAQVMREKGLAGKEVGLVGRESYLHSSHRLLAAELGEHDLYLQPADDILETQRRRKSDAELGLMRHAAAVGVQCMDAMMAAVEVGRTEGQIVGEGYRLAAELGASPYDIAVASGPHSGNFQWARMPSWDTERRLEHGDLIHIDFWGPVLGYYTDFVRSSVVGRDPTSAQRELLEGAVAFVQEVIEGIRPGATFGELWLRGDGWLARNGFAEDVSARAPGEVALSDMFPGFGHCIGAGVEGPYIVEGETTPIESGMVIAVEILLTKDGVGGAGFEQDVVVHPDRIEVLTEACRSRWWNA